VSDKTAAQLVRRNSNSVMLRTKRKRSRQETAGKEPAKSQFGYRETGTFSRTDHQVVGLKMVELLKEEQ